MEWREERWREGGSGLRDKRLRSLRGEEPLMVGLTVAALLCAPAGLFFLPLVEQKMSFLSSFVKEREVYSHKIKTMFSNPRVGSSEGRHTVSRVGVAAARQHSQRVVRRQLGPKSRAGRVYLVTRAAAGDF